MVLSRIFHILAVLTGILVFIASTGTWNDVLGAAGVGFAIFLFPFAILSFPLAGWIATGDELYLLGYMFMAVGMGFLYLSDHFSNKSQPYRLKKRIFRKGRAGKKITAERARKARGASGEEKKPEKIEKLERAREARGASGEEKKPEKIEKLERAREVSDLLEKLNRYTALACNCGAKFRIPPDFKGSSIRCPRCGTINPIPGG